MIHILMIQINAGMEEDIKVRKFQKEIFSKIKNEWQNFLKSGIASKKWLNKKMKALYCVK